MADLLLMRCQAYGTKGAEDPETTIKNIGEGLRAMTALQTSAEGWLGAGRVHQSGWLAGACWFVQTPTAGCS